MMLAWPVVVSLALGTVATGQLVAWTSRRLTMGDRSGTRPQLRILTLLLGSSLAVAAGVTESVLEFALLVIAGHLLAIVASVDLLEFRIPNVLTYPAMLACAVAGLGGLTIGVTSQVIAAVIGSVAFSSTLLAPHLWNPRLMGLGDVKLAAVLGFGIGWARGEPATVVPTVGWTIVTACAIGLGMALGGARQGVDERRGAATVAFGPALCIAGWGAAALSLWVRSGVS